jgi:hypothetical protein
MSTNKAATTARVDAVVMARRWHELEKREAKAGYWVAIPDDTDSIMDGADCEIVYVVYDGRWHVCRVGELRKESTADFRFLYPVHIPQFQ